MLDRAQGNTFKHAFEIIDGQRINHLEATCHRCGTVGRLKLNRKTTLSQDFADRGFAKEGWKLGPVNRSKDECPTCIRGEKIFRQARLQMAAPEVRDEPSEEERFICEYIGERLLPPNEDGEIHFQAPWTEGKILRELVSLFPDLTLTKIQQIRAAHFGKITMPKKPVADPDRVIQHLTEELEATKTVIARMAERIDLLTKQQTQAMGVVKDRLEEFQTSLEELEDEQDRLLAKVEENRPEDIKATANADREFLKQHKAGKAADA